MINDELRPVPGLPNYSVTSDGRVWSDPRPRTRGGWRAAHPNNHGYLHVKVCVGGVMKTLYVHRAVALAWLPEPDGDEYTEVRHINFDPSDNRAENLRWSTLAERMALVREGKAS